MPTYQPKEPAVGPGAFFGRELLVRNLTRGLEGGRNFVLIGGPALGKTSTLYQVASQFRLRWSRDPGETKLVPIVLDVSSWKLDPRSVAEALWEQIDGALTHPQIAGPVADRVKFQAKRGEDPFVALRTALAELSRTLRGTAGWSRYVLLLDNADPLSERQHEPILRFLSELQVEDTPYAPVAIVLSGGRLLRESLRERRSPIRRYRLMTLTVFRESEALALIKRGLSHLPEKSMHSVLSLSGQHPGILVRMLGEIETRGVQEDPRVIATELSGDLATVWTRIWNEFDMARRVTYRGAYAAPEHALMQLAMDLRQPLTVKLAERELAIRPLKEYAEFLEYTGVVEGNLVAGEPMFSAGGTLWNSWYGERIRR
ncbi:MAG: hypothetical protein AAFU77_00430 [Myxococcota bacterium]